MLKKIGAWMIALLLVLSMSACSNSDTDKKADQSEENVSTESEPDTSVDQSTENFGKIEAEPETWDGESSAQGSDGNDKEDAVKPPVEIPDKKETEITEVPEIITDCTYEEYQNMAPETQQEFFNKFESMEKFFEWYNAAKEKYEKENGAIEIGNGEIDIDGIINDKK